MSLGQILGRSGECVGRVAGLLRLAIDSSAIVTPLRNVPNDLYSRPLSKGILDGQLLASFVELSDSRQRDLVGPIGTDRETVLNDISELGGLW